MKILPLAAALMLAATTVSAEERQEVTTTQVMPAQVAFMIFENTAPGATFADFAAENQHLGDLDEDTMLAVGTKYFFVPTNKYQEG